MCTLPSLHLILILCIGYFAHTDYRAFILAIHALPGGSLLLLGLQCCQATLAFLRTWTM